MQRRSELWQLFSAFFRIGLFTFGGGYAMLPMIEKEVIDKHGWTDREEILDIYAMAQSVPGVIAANTAIFLGNRLYGFWGAIAALTGVVTPSIVIIISIALSFEKIKSSVVLTSAFEGLRAGVVGLIAAAAVRIGRTAVKDWFGLLVCGSAFVVSLTGFVHIIWIMIVGGFVGFLYYRRRELVAE